MIVSLCCLEPNRLLGARLIQNIVAESFAAGVAAAVTAALVSSVAVTDDVSACVDEGTRSCFADL